MSGGREVVAWLDGSLLCEAGLALRGWPPGAGAGAWPQAVEAPGLLLRGYLSREELARWEPVLSPFQAGCRQLRGRFPFFLLTVF